VALPLFVRQNAGPALRGGGDCSGDAAALLPSGPGSRTCLSRRVFTIRLRHPRGQRLRRASVRVDGKRVRVVRRHGRLRARIDLRGKRKRVVTVTVRAVTRSGKRVREVRRYRTCIPTKKKPRRR
jgi:hypothetical protein